MAWIAADRTWRGQCLGSGRGGTVCLAMKVLSRILEKLSGQLGDNARNLLDLAYIGHTKESVDQYTSRKIWENSPAIRGIMLGKTWT